ncbi:hypothetical protein LFX25_06050 [Leptospira sp. FAT2]|uniref:hypothetical protein n=1 Tax=Leptospira sanjuanensis TaxID=2879643 RepID=UPI001EE8AA5F|nr:hypothetical protein [Leptospira sanjuanensis]MCG6192801.1 hypothetical protein [Leptospira sanjuanensis]
MTNNHLTLINRLNLSCANRFLIHKNHAFVCELYGSAREIHIISLENPEAPNLVRSLTFESAIGSLAIQDEVLYATESRRAVHKFSLENVSDPKRLDSYILLGYELYDVQIVSDKALLAMNWDGVGVVDLRKPDEIQPTAKQKIAKGYAKQFVPFHDHFLMTNGLHDDRFLYEISVQNGNVEILSRKEFPDFNPSDVFTISSGAALFGETKKGKKEYSSILILNDSLQPIGEPIRIERTPKVCLSLSDGNVLFGFDYAYALFNRSNHSIAPLFQQFEDGNSKEYIEVPSNPKRIDPEYDVERDYYDEGNDEDNADSDSDEAEDYESDDKDEDSSGSDEEELKDSNETENDRSSAENAKNQEAASSDSEEKFDPSRLNNAYPMNSLKCVQKIGNYLFATHGNNFFTFKIGENSPFQKIVSLEPPRL